MLLPLSFNQYYIVEVKKGNYNDEHAHANVWNHMTSKGIHHDKAKMHAELKKASKDKKHPLHVNNTKHGWQGGVVGDHASHHAEHKKAVDSIHHMVTAHKDIAKHANAGHKMRVVGGDRGKLSSTTHSHYGTYSGGDKKVHKRKADAASVSKADLHIHPPGEHDKPSARISLKTGVGKDPHSYTHKDAHPTGGKPSARSGKTSSRAKINRTGVVTIRKPGHVVMSGGPEETLSTYHHAAHKMLKKTHGHLSKEQRQEHHKKIMHSVKKAANSLHHMTKEKVGDKKALKGHVATAQKHIDGIHKKHPELQHHVEHEATFGHGKFGGSKEHATPTHVVVTSQ
jgi:hypothetical protein